MGEAGLGLAVGARERAAGVRERAEAGLGWVAEGILRALVVAARVSEFEGVAVVGKILGAAMTPAPALPGAWQACKRNGAISCKTNYFVMQAAYTPTLIISTKLP